MKRSSDRTSPCLNQTTLVNDCDLVPSISTQTSSDECICNDLTASNRRTSTLYSRVGEQPGKLFNHLYYKVIVIIFYFMLFLMIFIIRQKIHDNLPSHLLLY